MPRILILASIAKAFYNFSFEVVEALRNSGYEVVISIPPDPLNREFERIGCRVVESTLDRHGKNPLAELRLIFEYRALCRGIRPDLIVTYTIKPNTYGGAAARAFHIPYVSVVTGMGTVFYNNSAGNRAIRAMLKFGIGKAERVFFQNSANLELFRDGGYLRGPWKLVAGSGVNLQKHSLLPFPGPDEKIRFLMPARASREKGVAEYIQAAEAVGSRHPECEFHFAGFTEESEYGKMIRAAHDRGVIVNHDFLKFDALRELEKSVQAVVLPSYHEGMSNVLLEGAAAGRALLTTDIPGCREAVLSGVSGLLCVPKSGSALEDVLERFLALTHAERAQMGLAGREHVEAHFDRTTVIDAYLSEFARILGGKS